MAYNPHYKGFEAVFHGSEEELLGILKGKDFIQTANISGELFFRSYKEAISYLQAHRHNGFIKITGYLSKEIYKDMSAVEKIELLEKDARRGHKPDKSASAKTNAFY